MRSPENKLGLILIGVMILVVVMSTCPTSADAQGYVIKQRFDDTWTVTPITPRNPVYVPRPSTPATYYATPSPRFVLPPPYPHPTETCVPVGDPLAWIGARRTYP